MSATISNRTHLTDAEMDRALIRARQLRSEAVIGWISVPHGLRSLFGQRAQAQPTRQDYDLDCGRLPAGSAL